MFGFGGIPTRIVTMLAKVLPQEKPELPDGLTKTILGVITFQVGLKTKAGT